jgi:hypothetical protein
MRYLLLYCCLVFTAIASKAQTSLRANLLGPMPVIEQHFLPRHSIEVAYAPVHWFKQRYFNGAKQQFLSIETRHYSDCKASTQWIAYRFYLKKYDDRLMRFIATSPSRTLKAKFL